MKLVLVSNAMRYSIDLRQRVLKYIESGGTKVSASQRFSISRGVIYQWLRAEDPLTYQKPGPRAPRVLDPTALEQHVLDFPDQTLSERARHFQVSKSSVWYGLRKLGYTRKKSWSGIRRDAKINARRIFRNSQLWKLWGSLSFIPMKAVFVKKAIDVMLMRPAVNVFWVWYRVNAAEQQLCSQRALRTHSPLRS